MYSISDIDASEGSLVDTYILVIRFAMVEWNHEGIRCINIANRVRDEGVRPYVVTLTLSPLLERKVSPQSGRLIQLWTSLYKKRFVS